jgi:N-acetylglucosamine-6-phosphate deacetylase
MAAHGDGGAKATSEAFDELVTPPMTPVLAPIDTDLGLKKGEVTKMSFERPFYEMIVDGIHSHPNSVRVSWILSCAFDQSKFLMNSSGAARVLGVS